MRACIGVKVGKVLEEKTFLKLRVMMKGNEVVMIQNQLSNQFGQEFDKDNTLHLCTGKGHTARFNEFIRDFLNVVFMVRVSKERVQEAGTNIYKVP